MPNHCGSDGQSFETTRSCCKALHCKLGVGNRAQAEDRLLQLRLVRLVGR